MASIKTAITVQYNFVSRYKNLKREIVKCNSKTHFKKQFVNRGQALKNARIKQQTYEGKFFSSLYRAIEQGIKVIRPTICTRVFCSKILTILKLFYTH
jgi:hypothetical protein